MLKSIGLGICCLTLGVAGSICHASYLPVDNHNDGNKCIKVDVKDCDVKGFDFKGCDLKLDLFKNDCHDIKPVLDCKDHGKEVCNIDWHKDLPSFKCDDNRNDNNNDHCDLVIDHCRNYDSCDHGHGCDPAAVPAPSAAAFGGLGVFGIMLMAGIRSRRSAIC